MHDMIKITGSIIHYMSLAQEGRSGGIANPSIGPQNACRNPLGEIEILIINDAGGKRFMKWTRKPVIKILLLLAVLTLVFTPGAWASAGEQELLQEIKSYVERDYVGQVDPEVLEATSIEELFQKLGDPHSGYMTPEEFENFKIASAQEYAGVGMQLQLEGDYVRVVKVFPNTPAERVGVKPGDEIRAINGEDMKGRSLEEVAGLIRGKAGTAVLIEFARKGLAEPIIVSVTRENIHLEVVHHEMLEQGIGYIKLDSFTPTAGAEFKEALEGLRSQGMQGLIFDLRQNTGGYLNAALDIGANFAGEGQPLLHVVGRGNKTTSYRSLIKAFDLPLVVLVDGDSASASEIVAGIIRDSGAGLIMGTTTFGKASVQSVYALSNGGGLKLTTARYLTPKKYDINGVGLIPDQVEEDEAKQLEMAVEYLREQIKKLPRHELVIMPGRALWNGENINLEPAPYIAQGQLLVPLRATGELFGLKIEWDGTNNQVIASKDNKKLQMLPDQAKVVINGKVHQLNVSAVHQGKVFIPIRLLADFLDAGCEYNGETGSVTIRF